MARKHKNKKGKSSPARARQGRDTAVYGQRPQGGEAASVAQTAPKRRQASACKLQITLKSDLCAGSGDGFSSGIDQDVCYDARGVPYIPARRIKGCLREVARDIDIKPEVIDALFGSPGAQVSGALTISNAVLDEPDTSGGTAATLDRYTYTRAQTRIDRATGSADDNTLRFVRVVKHYQPDGGGSFKELLFTATVTLDEADPASVKKQLVSCTRALRNIGMGRNRGFGAVRCEFVWCELKDTKDGNGSENMVHEEIFGDTAVLSYVVRLDAPVMLPQNNGERSHLCIPGTSVMGFFASKRGTRSDFDELFFGGKVHFSPLYPMDGNERCLPAAPFVAKIKGGTRDGEYHRADTFDPGPLESIKPLKDGFMSPTTWRKVDVVTEIAYHHSTGADGTLYTQECLSAGQQMAGFVECPKKWAKTLKRVLSQGHMSFGRSKSAQYARCSLVPCKSDLSCIGKMMTVKKGKSYALLLESDVLVLGDSACPSVAIADLESNLRSANVTGDWYPRCDAADPYAKECDASDLPARHCATSVSARTVGGYNAKWNQKRPHVRVFGAGSCLVFKAECDAANIPMVQTTGSRQSEGYGRVRLIALDDVSPKNPSQGQSHNDDVESEASPINANLSDREKARQTALKYADETARNYFIGNDGFTSSFVGRLAMMVEESAAKNGRNFDADLDARIESIKDEDKKEHAKELIGGLREKLKLRNNWQLEKECLLLVLALGKYFQMQARPTDEGGDGR